MGFEKIIPIVKRIYGQWVNIADDAAKGLKNGKVYIKMESSRMFKTCTKIIDKDGTVYAEGLATFLKLPIEKIANDYDLHEEMPYLIEDGITEIDYNYSFS